MKRRVLGDIVVARKQCRDPIKARMLMPAMCIPSIQRVLVGGRTSEIGCSGSLSGWDMLLGTSLVQVVETLDAN
jgi:hypothetical protein